MNSVIRKTPWALMLVLLLAVGCAAPGSQVKATDGPDAAAAVVTVTGEEMPDRVRLNIEGNTTLAYTVFRLSEPLRLIVDLADTDVSGLDSDIPVAMGNVDNVTTVQFDEEAGKIGRLEITLLELWEYETSRTDNTIVVDFLKPVSVVEGDEVSPAEVEAAAEVEPVVADEPKVEVVELTLPSESGSEEAMEAEAKVEAEMVAPGEPAAFINSVLFEESAGTMRIEFVGDGQIRRYETISLDGPARIVLDISGVAKGFAPSRIPVEMGGVSRIRVGEHYDDDRLRFVMDVDGGEVPPFTVEPSNGSLVLTMGQDVVASAPMSEEPAVEMAAEPMADTAPEPEETVQVAEVAADTPVESAPEAALPAASGVTDISYSPADSGGEVVISASDSVNYDVSQPDDRHLLVDLSGITLPASLVRSQDTRDMAGALMALSSFNPRGADGARVSLTFMSGTEYEVYQGDDGITVALTAPEASPDMQVVEVQAPTMTSEPAAQAAAPQAMEEEESIFGPKKKYTGEKITLDFQNADLLNVLRLIAEVSGLNIISSDAVSGRITMRMVDVPWDQALDIILKTKALGQVREGNVVRIAPLTMLETERAAELKAREAQMKVEELVLEIIPISYSKAEDLVSQLTPFLSGRGSINTDKRTNSLIVKDIKANVEKVRGLVVELDIPTPQVRIEARIVIVDEAYVKNLGIKWGAVYDDGTNQIFGNAGPADAALGGGNFLVNLPASNPSSVMGFSFGGVDNFTSLDLRLSALEQQNKGRIISSPSLLVIQNETASIEVNNPFPENRTSTEVSDEGSTTTTEVSFPDIWTKLRITPQVTSNKDIFMEVYVEKDSKGQQAIFDENTFTGVNEHKLETKIILKNHGTAVIGGVFTENKKDGSSSVPFISKIPILGWMFKNKSVENTREELLIFINASIVEA
jgi:type IV pilus assembly protein PilQ